ncbi:hypothetical protein SELMODRAFT_267388 [Selaginella moellendorffii]|uniref:MHD domain-containing protein n=1 Tax=Selaginella moellendorffii TaxID=88036 RepID=D8RHP6_SELML|nr:AP-5 complex subunit mu [Selaginella moellendorffii]EFJ28322.1 hypothetical protein SELMODRAFT_267388 [Selaginella moellendorffii]|eukprot:XP_002970192.1 AP-5 complex subunit mu [Selaginella moellendorffii]
MGCSIRALWILNQHRHVVFSRRFPTVEKKWKNARSKHGDGICYSLPSDAQLIQSFVERKEREGSFRGLATREDYSQPGSDSWVDDPITRSIISLQIPKPDESGELYLLWPIVFHIRGPFHILVLPSVEPHHLATYENLCWRADCGGPVANGHNSLSSLLLDLPSITGAFCVAQTLGDLIVGEALEPEININPSSTMGGLLDSITGGIGIASITARAKPVAAPVAAAATAIAAGVTGAAPAGILGSTTTKGILKASDKEALLGFITSAMPFGTPLDLNPITINAIKANGFSAQDIPPQDQKQPAWKPYLFKSKQKLVFALHEVVTAALYDRDDVADVITLKGQLLCRADLEGLPDVNVQLSCPSSGEIDGVTFHPCAQALDHGPDKQTITFSPPLGNFVLAKYMATPAFRPPLQGFYQLSMVSDDEGAFLFRMKLLEGYKGPIVMEQCSLSIPFHRRTIAALDGAPSMGTVSNTDHSIEWKILAGHRSTISKSMEVTYSGTVKFAPRAVDTNQRDTVGFSDDDEIDCGNENKMDKADMNLVAAKWEDPFCWEAYSYAKASLKLVGGTMSGVSIDTKTVAIYPTAKVPCEVSSQIISGEYIFWNSLGRYPHVAPA